MNNFIIENNHFKLLQKLPIRGVARTEEQGIKNNFNFISLDFRAFAFMSWNETFFYFEKRKRFNLIQNHKPKFKIKTIEKFFLLFANSAVCWTCGKFPNNFSFLLWCATMAKISALSNPLHKEKEKLLLINSQIEKCLKGKCAIKFS